MSSTNKYTIELLIDYVEGLLSNDQMERVESILASDEYAEQMVIGIRTYYAKHGEDREGLLEWLEQGASLPMSSHASGGKSRTRRRRLIIYSAAAACVAAIVYLGVRPTDNYQELLAEYQSEVYTIPSAQRSTEREHEAYRAYENGEFEQAEGFLEEIIASGEYNVKAKFLLGLSQFYQGDYQSAKEHLEDAAYNSTPVTQQAYWYLALTHLKLEEWEEGIELLEVIVQRSQFKKDEAKALLSTGTLSNIADTRKD